MGATASRLIAGNHPEHERLEATLADAFERRARAHLLERLRSQRRRSFRRSSAVATSMFSDALNHASLIDGCRSEPRRRPRLSARRRRRRSAQLLDRHRGSARRALIVTDGLFSMDGDFAPLARDRRARAAIRRVDLRRRRACRGRRRRSRSGHARAARPPRADRRHRRHARQGLRRGRRVRLRIVDARAVSDQSRALIHLLDRDASGAGRRRGASAAHCSGRAASDANAFAATSSCCTTRWMRPECRSCIERRRQSERTSCPS